MNYTNSKIALICLTRAFPGYGLLPFMAGAESGFYLGAGVGDATVKDNDFDAE